MAKGKQAAAAARRRLQEAGERIAELEERLRSEGAEAHVREESLKTEVQNLKGRLLREVDEIAAERIRRLRDQYEARLSTLRRQHREAIEEAFRYINDNGRIELTMADHTHVASILGMDPGEWVSLRTEAPRRTARRANKAHANAVAEVERQGGRL